MNLEYLESLYFNSIKGIDKASDLGKQMALKYINMAYKEVFLAHNWIYRKRYGQITLIPRYTTGTVSVTKYDETNLATSKTITFSGATLTDSMIGRFIRFQDGEKWYQILYLTGSTAYLDAPVSDVSSGSKTFEIWNRFYYLKSDVADFLDFGRWANGRLEYNPDLLDRYIDISKESDAPSSFDVIGADQFTDTESSGTLTIAEDSNLATVSGLNLLSSGFDTGDIATINDVDYYVRRIESDTRLKLFNYFADEVPSATAFTLKKNNPLGFEFYNPPDDYQSIPYVYLGRAYDLVHRTKDKILLPANFIPAIISRAQYWTMKDTNDERFVQILSVYQSELDGLKSKVQVVKPRFTKFSPKISGLAPGRS